MQFKLSNDYSQDLNRLFMGRHITEGIPVQINTEDMVIWTWHSYGAKCTESFLNP